VAVVTSYTTLVTAVGDYLARSDLTSFIPNFIQNWEERFLRDSDNWGSWMETALSVTISANVAALPTNYLGLKTAYITGANSPPLKRITLEQMYARYPRGAGTAGCVAFIARNGANFEFGPENVSGTLAGTYYAKPTALRSFASDAAAHFLIVNAPDLCIFGALMEAMPFIKKDERLPMWAAAFETAIDTYRKRMVGEDSSGSAPFAVVM
jgi:hypothetical protein